MEQYKAAFLVWFELSLYLSRFCEMFPFSFTIHGKSDTTAHYKAYATAKL